MSGSIDTKMSLAVGQETWKVCGPELQPQPCPPAMPAVFAAFPACNVALPLLAVGMLTDLMGLTAGSSVQSACFCDACWVAQD